MRGKEGLMRNVRIAIWTLYINMAKLGRGNSGFYVLYAAGNLPRTQGDLKSGIGRSVQCVER